VLLLYWRIFSERWQIWMLRITSALSVVAFIAITLALSLVCLPYHQRWQIVPPPPLYCTASPRILITASCVNAVTDVLVTLTREDCGYSVDKCSCSVCLCRFYGLLTGLYLRMECQIQVKIVSNHRRRIGVFILLASGMFVLAAWCVRSIVNNSS
jgi:hypothetical protein